MKSVNRHMEEFQVYCCRKKLGNGEDLYHVWGQIGEHLSKFLFKCPECGSVYEVVRGER